MAHCHPLLQEALEAHGGHNRWRTSGVLPRHTDWWKAWELKGAPFDSCSRRATSEFSASGPESLPFGEPTGHDLDSEHVEITAGDGSIVAERNNGREAFDRSFNGQWDPLNLAYFNGYAMWTYHAAPFVFGEHGYEARRRCPERDRR